MIVEGKVSVDALVRAVEMLGGTIAWAENARAKIVGAVAVPRVEVDDDAAYEELPGSYFDHHDDEVQDIADPGDVRDFVAACGRGDVMIAGALAPRLFSSDANIAAIERGLHERRAA